jgi:TatD DNase family protein
MHLIDSHAHLEMYDSAELAQVLARAQAAEVRTILAIGIGDGPHEMHRALDIAESTRSPELPAIFASAGIHPQEAAKATPEALGRLATLALNPRCIAIGEIGLDYYHVDNPMPDIQQAAFIAQLEIAATARKPILIHCRTSELATPAAKEKFGPADAWEDLLSLIAEHWEQHALGGIMHCFSGTVDHARRSIDAGFHLSFAGNLTYPAAKTIREAAAFAPADRILVETDAPFLAPIPFRGQRNEPALVAHTAAALAELRGISLNQLATETTRNFNKLFNLEPCTLYLEPSTLYSMASDNSFDVVSKVDLQEVKNAIDQASKEVHTRFDLKDTKSTIELEGEETIQLASASDYSLKAVIEILSQRMVKRGISLKNLEFEKVEPASNSSVRQKIKLKQGVNSDSAKKIVAMIKETKLKAQASIQGDTVRVVSKDKDVLQQIMSKLRAGDFGVALQFTNYR